jgi:anti-sigma regulatory factor (Ser/Thr protein kinase)
VCTCLPGEVKPVSAHASSFPARMEALARVLAFVEGVCARAGVGREESLRLTLVVEELFVNTVVHGHGGDSDAQVRLRLDPQPSGVHVSYEDEAPRFDPSTGPDQAPDPSERAPGGLGLVLVRRLSSDLAYARAENANRVTFVIEGS